jgi:predicted esterase
MIYLDKIIHIFFKNRHNFNKKVILKNYIKKEFILRNNDTLCVFCPPWHQGRFATSFLRYRLKKKDYSFLTYDIHSHVLSTDYKRTREYILKVIETISKDITDYNKKYNFKNIIIIGISLGCLYALNVSIKNKEINKVILASPGYSLEHSILTGYSTNRLNHLTIDSYGIAYKKLQKEWKDLAPYHKIKNLKNKEITIFLSKKDCINAYEGAQKLINILKKNKVKVKTEINNHLGHYGTIIRFLLFPRKYI